MAIHSLQLLVRIYLTDPASLRQRCPLPVLAWEPPAKPESLIETTGVTDLTLDFERGDAVAIEVVKGLTPNAFPFGVTVGHAENNDIVLRHHQVSRFHASFQESKGKRFLVDANSRNGTWVDRVKLTPSKPFPLPPRAALCFGGLEVTYLEPDQLAAWLDSRLKSAEQH